MMTDNMSNRFPRWILPPLLALQFLTRIPVPQKRDVTDSCTGNSVLFYPLVGLIIGGLLVLWASFLQTAAVQIQAIVILAFWVFIPEVLRD